MDGQTDGRMDGWRDKIDKMNLESSFISILLVL